MTADPHRLIESFELQQGYCARMDAPLYASLSRTALGDLRAGGVTADIVAGWQGDAVDAVVPLRLFGGVHRLVLAGSAPLLAPHFPTVGGSPDPSTLGADFLTTLDLNVGYLADALAIAPQTNDIGRSAALLAGLFSGIGRDGQSVRLLGIGSAGGLNLCLDRYRYEAGTWSWGDPDASVVIELDWEGEPPPLRPEVDIVERRGCDVMPLDVTDPNQALRMLSFIWPDHLQRFARTRGAIEVARRERPLVDEADAAVWIEERLAESAPSGATTVVQHSVMWQYLPDETKAAVSLAIEEAGERATEDRPLMHVAYEPPPPSFDGRGMILTVTRWPGGVPEVLARGHAHGLWLTSST